MTFLWLLACRPAQECDPYRDNDAAWSLCVARWAASAPTAEEAGTRCAVDRPHEADCRATWVEAATSRPDMPARASLLAFCRSDECAFRVIDQDPPADVLAAVDLCATHAGAYGADCATHAYARWAVTEPDAAEIARVRAAATLYPDCRDLALGHLFACATPPVPCPADYDAACAHAAEEVSSTTGFCAQWKSHARPGRELMGTPTGPPDLSHPLAPGETPPSLPPVSGPSRP
jgi:hypothetical protein